MRPGIDYIGISTPFYCNDGNGHFIMHKRGEKCRAEKGKWDFGSGQLSLDEQPEESVLREVKEEYGVAGEIQEQLPIYFISRKEGGIKTRWLAIPFFVKIDVKKARIMEPDKATEIGIFTLDKLPQPLHSAVQFAMQKYADRFARYGVKS